MTLSSKEDLDVMAFLAKVESEEAAEEAKRQKPVNSVGGDKKSAAYFGPDSNVRVVFVLGGPGAGKGTQCSKLTSTYKHLFHLSAGDLLRAEQKKANSPVANLIFSYIKEGKIVPMQITIHLLKQAMKERVEEEQRKSESGNANNELIVFLVDGFPRAIDQGLAFEEKVCKSSCILLYDCPESVMTDRILKRGLVSGRIDDNLESIKKRLKTFKETTEPVIEHYERVVARPIVRIDCTPQPDLVFSETIVKLKDFLAI